MKIIETLEKSSKRQKQKFKILADNPEFQKDLAVIRRKWNIPENGLQSDEELEKWETWICDATDNFYDNEWPKYRAELADLETNDHLKFRERKKEIDLLAPINAFKKDYIDLILKYNIPPRWKEGIRFYIKSGKTDYLVIGLGTMVQADEDTGQRMLFIRVDEDTTKDDLVHMWRSVKFQQDRLPYRVQDKFQPIKNLDLYQIAYKLKQEGKSAREIADIMGTFERPLCDSDIYEYIRRYKEISGIN